MSSADRTSSPSPTMLHAESLSRLPWLHHGFTTRAGGISHVYGRPADLNLGLTQEDDPAAVHANRRAVLEALTQGAPGPWSLVQTRQIHSTTILALTREAPSPTAAADGLVTDVPGSLLAVLAADCVPILLADRRRHVIAAVHAGWRGTVEGIVGVAIRTMQQSFGCRPEDLAAGIGPSIGPCCYETGEEVHTRFHTAFPYAQQLFTGTHLDLWQANRRQLLTAGLPAAEISLLAACTACTYTAQGPRFFSHRAQHGRTGRMMGLIGVIPDEPQTPDPLA